MSDTESVKPETIDTSLLQARYGAEAAPAAGKFNDVLRGCSRIGRCALNLTIFNFICPLLKRRLA